MCMIIIKEQGVEAPTLATIQNAFRDNADGAGYAILRAGEKVLSLRKGLMSVGSLISSLTYADIKKDDLALYHFRLATNGEVSKGNCHPFPLSNSVSELRKVRGEYDQVMAHNGILDNTTFGNYEGDALSDTMLFVRDILSEPCIKDNLELPAIEELIDAYVDGSRVVIVSADGTLRRYGGWYVDDEGLLYSGFMVSPGRMYHETVEGEKQASWHRAKYTSNARGIHEGIKKAQDWGDGDTLAEEDLVALTGAEHADELELDYVRQDCGESARVYSISSYQEGGQTVYLPTKYRLKEAGRGLSERGQKELEDLREKKHGTGVPWDEN